MMPHGYLKTPTTKPTSTARSMATVDRSALFDAVVAANVKSPSKALSVGCNESNDMESCGLDSGYASQASTPASAKSTIFADNTSMKKRLTESIRKPKQLRAYTKPIPSLTWERFSDLREQYAESLNKLTQSFPGCPSILMTLQVLGEDEDNAEPWVFVQCDKVVFKKVNNFFKQSAIKVEFEPNQTDDRSPRLRVLVCPIKARYLAKDERTLPRHDYLMNGNPIGVFSTASIEDTLCGLQIMTESLRQATIGGIIRIVDKRGQANLFGMSAGHFILQDPYQDCENEPIDDSDDEWALDYYSRSLYINTEESYNIHRIGLSQEVGTVLEVSHQLGINLDWALIEFLDPGHSVLPNMCMEGDAFEDEIVLEDEKCVLDFPEIDVMIILAEGAIRGVMSSSKSYLVLPPGNMLVETYLLTLTDKKSLQPGTSGAWVINTHSGKLYGHVVASDVFGRVYIVPIEDSFEDIKNQLSALSVSLFDSKPPSFKGLSSIYGSSEPLEHSHLDSGYSSRNNTPKNVPQEVQTFLLAARPPKRECNFPEPKLKRRSTRSR